jgi:hypothetical protein
MPGVVMILFLTILACGARAIPAAGKRRMGFTLVIPAQLIGLILVDRTGVGDFLGNAELMQLVDDLARLHFQLPRQLIDSNLTHIKGVSFTCLLLLFDWTQSGL